MMEYSDSVLDSDTCLPLTAIMAVEPVTHILFPATVGIKICAHSVQLASIMAFQYWPTGLQNTS